ncbi:MAG: hypothetical protein FWG48_01540, partial [Oscillospiraceae bacterium]|nr:hypothetical protein [Oscillospiraceae bacterium]
MKKRFLALLIVAVMVVAFAVPAMAGNTPKAEPTELTWTDGFGFHCNACGGNGQTSVIYAGTNPAVIKAIGNIKKQPAGSMVVLKGDQKDIFGTKTYPIKLERVGTTTEWNLITGDDIVCETCGRTDWVTYSNQNGVINGKNIQAHHPALPEPPVNPKGGLTFTKTVKGVDIIVWLDEKFSNADEILAAIFFDLVSVDTGEVVATAQIEDDFIKGNIVDFGGEIPAGDYLVRERLESPADEVFKPHADVPITIVDGEITTIGGIIASDFDKDGDYFVSWEKVSEYGSVILETKYTDVDDVYTHINKDGNPNAVYNIAVTNAAGDSFLSYCGSHSSQNFYEEEYNVAPLAPAKKDAIIQALNFIYEQYGSIDAWAEWGTDLASVDGHAPGYIRPLLEENSTYAIAQIVIWMILHSEEIDYIEVLTNNNNIGFNAGGVGNYTVEWVKDWPAEYEQLNGAVLYVLGNYADANPTKKVVDLVFLTAAASVEGYDEDGSVGSYYYQPQIVPLFGESVEFDNEPDDPYVPKGSLSFTKKVEDMNIVAWLTAHDLSTDILEGLEFYLDGIGEDGETYSYGPAYPDNWTGEVVFGSVYPGTYTLSEEITGAAVGVFKKMKDITIVIYDGSDEYFVLGGTVFGSAGGKDDTFDRKATYSTNMANGAHSFFYLNGATGYDFIRHTAYNFSVTNKATGETFASFCANWGSSGIGDLIDQTDAWAPIVTPAKVIAIVEALNYITSEYGSLGKGDEYSLYAG